MTWIVRRVTCRLISGYAFTSICACEEDQMVGSDVVSLATHGATIGQTTGMTERVVRHDCERLHHDNSLSTRSHNKGVLTIPRNVVVETDHDGTSSSIAIIADYPHALVYDRVSAVEYQCSLR